ncbi:MAG: M48 family metallopeptidase [Clostridia bacterium]|nr:M48 family metallopeptidase [Clostridia bacterium]
MDYEIIYSRRKTLSLCIKNTRLIIRAPLGTPKRKIEEAINSHREWIEKHTERQKNKEERFAGLSDKQIAELKRQARKVLSAKAEYYSALMGVDFGRISITSAKTRFGSCSSKGDIAFSYRLMLYPEAAVDYVVVHELAHRKEMNHSKAFYKIVEDILPDYKERRKLLRG